MGSVINSIFGGGMKMPEAPAPSPLPSRDEVAEDQTTRDAERKKLRARAGGVRSTLLTPAQTAGAQNLLGLPGAPQ